MVKKPLTPSQPRLCLSNSCNTGALRAATGAGRGDAADRKLGTAQATAEPLMLPSFQGSHKAASLISTCLSQAFTMVRDSAVKLKMSSVTPFLARTPCHHLVSLEPPSPHPHSQQGTMLSGI